METNLYEGQPFPFTAEWYEGREHAPHLEQGIHRPRMLKVADIAVRSATDRGYASIVDLGAGDGGTLSLLEVLRLPPNDVQMWGYDLMQVNVDYAKTVRNVDIRCLDFVDEPIDWAELTIITECLEHLENPHGMVRRIGTYSKAIIASSPASETVESHDECHAWVWDTEGYASLIREGGFEIIEHHVVSEGYDFQVVLGVLP